MDIVLSMLLGLTPLVHQIIGLVGLVEPLLFHVGSRLLELTTYPMPRYDAKHIKTEGPALLKEQHSDLTREYKNHAAGVETILCRNRTCSSSLYVTS